MRGYHVLLDERHQNICRQTLTTHALQVSKTGMTTSLRLGSETAFEFDQLEVRLPCIAMTFHIATCIQHILQGFFMRFMTTPDMPWPCCCQR